MVGRYPPNATMPPPQGNKALRGEKKHDDALNLALFILFAGEGGIGTIKSPLFLV